MESGTKLYSVNVQGFSKEFTEERIQELLSKFGEVVECCFAGPSLNEPHHEKTQAIVKFTSKMEAATAIARLDKQPPFFLSVDWTGSQPEREHWKKLDGRGDSGRPGVLYGRGSVGPKRHRGRSMDSNNSRGSVGHNNTRNPGNPLYVPAARPEPCANCFQEGRLRCSRCKTWYCTVVCQENHWTRHRDRCFAPPPLEHPDGSIYDVQMDVSNIKIVRSNDSESSSDEIISLKKLSKMGRSGPLNSTLKEDHVADKTVIEMVEKAPVLEIDLIPREKVTKTPAKETSIKAKEKNVLNCKMVEEEVREQLSDSWSLKSSVKPASHENNNNSELAAESNSESANKSKIKSVSPQIEDSTKEISKKAEVVSEFNENKTEDSPLLVGKPIQVTVSHVVSPSEFYVVPESSQNLFEAILLNIQDQPNAAPELLPGETCLARHEGLWYRARISQVAPDCASARVVLIDFGMVERIPVSEMKALAVYMDVGGVAWPVGMAGIAPPGGTWTMQEIENFRSIVDEGGETKFCATVIGYNKGETLVKLVDDDKNDVGELCVEVGVGIKVVNNFVTEKKQTLEIEVEDKKGTVVKSAEVVTTIESKLNAKEKSDSIKFGNPTEVLVVHCTSPRDMGVLPSSKSDQWNDLLTNTQDPPQGGVEPKVGQLYLTEHEGLWARALVQKISPDKTQVKVDLIDFGNVGLKIKTTELRKLTKYSEVEGLVERVRLAGLGAKGEKWEEPELELFKQVVDIGGETKFVVESVGKLDGIEMVNMKDAEGGDVKDMCVTLEIGIILEEVFTNVSNKYLPGEKDEKSKPEPNKSEDIREATKLQENSVSLKQKQIENVNIPEINHKNPQIIKESDSTTSSFLKSDETGKFPQQSIGMDRPEEVSVRFAESPNKFYLLQTSQSSVFKEVIQSCQGMPADDKVKPEAGLVCLAKFEDSWHRADVQKVSPDGSRVQLFLIDYGKIINVGRGQLKSLTKFVQVPGLVCEVGLAGIKPTQDQWTKEDIDNFNAVVDAGGETKFMAKAVGVDEDGVVRVEMIDLEENDIAQLCLMMEVGVPCNASLKQIDSRNPVKQNDIDTPQKKAVQATKCFPHTELPINIPTEVTVTHMDNPDKIYVLTTKANEKFMEVLVGCQEPPGGIIEPSIGLVCLAFVDVIWQRAEIKKIFPEKEIVQIYLVDDGKTKEVSVDVLRHLNKFTDLPGHVAKVGLINLGCGEEKWSQEALDLMFTILDVGGDTTFTVTNLGKDEDGVDRVKMIDTDGNDISHFCVEMKVGITVEHNLKSCELKKTVSNTSFKQIASKIPVKETSIKAKETNVIANINVEKERKQDTPQKRFIQAAKGFPRIELPVNIPTEVNVTHADNPDKIYLFPSEASESFVELLGGCQEPPSGIVEPAIGLVCLAFVDEIWHRAEVKKIIAEKETVQMYFVDEGRTVEVSVDLLRHLNKFTDVPGHVAEVGLINLGCGEEMWSQEALDLMFTILDVGGDTTFTVTNLGKDEDGVDRVKMIDTDGTDISHLCVEVKIGVTVEHKLKSSELKEIISKSKSPRTKPKAPIKPAPPLRTAISETADPFKSTTAIPQTTTSPDKIVPALNHFWRPPCADSVLTTVIRGSKFKVMKEAKLSVRYFSSICLPEDNSATNYLLNDLQSEAAACRASGDANVTLEVRSWVVAWSSSDQMYYRAVIVGVTPPDTYTAFLIDFAMTQQFKKADLIEMWPGAARHKAMAIQLTAIGHISPEVENRCNAHFDANATVDCVVSEIKDNEITVLIQEMGVEFTALPWYHCHNSVRTLFQTEGPAKAGEDKQLEEDQKIMMKDLKTSRLVEGAKVRYCGHGDKICDVYVKQETDEESVTSLMTTLNAAMSSREIREYREPVVGSIVAVKLSQDEQKMFYRASVTAINSKEKKAKLLLVDYGTRIMEDWANITWLPQEVRKEPMYCVPVVLANVLSSSVRFRCELLDDIARDYRSETLTLKIVSHTAPPVVKLINKTKTFNDALHFSEDVAEAEVLSEKEKKKLEIAQRRQQLALLEAELANI